MQSRRIRPSCQRISAAPTYMLAVNSLAVRYGRLQALTSVSLTVDQGELVTIIGSNGAGKTTLIMALSGVVRPESGEILLSGTRIDRLSPHAIVRRGLVQVPQGRQLFPAMTVEENLWMGAHLSAPRRASQDLHAVYDLFQILRDRRKQRAGTLSGGEQQMLAIGRALMARPKFLLLDEPSSGLAPKIIESLAQTLRLLHARDNLTMLLVEQNAELAFGLSQRGYVLANGTIVASGSTEQLATDPVVRKAYLGT